MSAFLFHTLSRYFQLMSSLPCLVLPCLSLSLSLTLLLAFDSYFCGSPGSRVPHCLWCLWQEHSSEHTYLSKPFWYRAAFHCHLMQQINLCISFAGTYLFSRRIWTLVETYCLCWSLSFLTGGSVIYLRDFLCRNIGFNYKVSAHHNGRDLERFHGLWIYKQGALPFTHTLLGKLLCPSDPCLHSLFAVLLVDSAP